MMNMENKVINNQVSVDKMTMRLKMMQGYMEMAEINKSICAESVHAADEAEQLQYKFLVGV